VREVQRGRGDNARAEQAVREFVRANPNHRLASDARYWAGETAYRRHDYRVYDSVSSRICDSTR
jgi:TolA-binding protein